MEGPYLPTSCDPYSHEQAQALGGLPSTDTARVSSPTSAKSASPAVSDVCCPQPADLALRDGDQSDISSQRSVELAWEADMDSKAAAGAHSQSSSADGAATMVAFISPDVSL